MPEAQSPGTPARGRAEDLETGSSFQPRFGADGLIAAIASDHRTGEVLMLAWMNADALDLTLKTGQAHFWARSRGRIWRKGEESGNTLRVIEIRTDCDQDALLLKVDVAGAGVACHTGARSCFYRRLRPGGPDGEPAIALERVADGA